VIELNGIINNFTFRNQENGYCIAKFKTDTTKETVTIVGNLLNVYEKQSLKIFGNEIKHPKYGKQIQVERFEEQEIDGIQAIENYLASGIFPGIGKATAKKIIKRFGDKTLEVLDTDIDRLTTISGITEKKLIKIKEGYEEAKEIKEIMLFLDQFKITAAMCVKIRKELGSTAIISIKKNPYTLTIVDGITFHTADNIALTIGIEEDSKFRIEAGIKHTLQALCNSKGHAFIEYDILVIESSKLLNQPKEKIIDVINDIKNKSIKIENINGVEAVYNIKTYLAEINVVNRIKEMLTTKYQNIKVNIYDEIEKFEKEKSIQLSDKQKEAIYQCVFNGFHILTGLPGAGKTTITNCIIHIFKRIGYKITLATPTGKSALRMSEVCGMEARTIHRTLEINFKDKTFVHNKENPLETNVVIVDETSMIDLHLFNSLIDAIPKKARLILIGDICQLPAIGTAYPLMDILNSKVVTNSHLDQIFRQGKESLIITNAHKINNGDMIITNDRDKDFFFIEEYNHENIVNTIVELVNTRLPKFKTGLDKLKDIQVISPIKKSETGVNNLNIKLQEALNPLGKGKKQIVFRQNTFREKDKITITKNNYDIEWKNKKTKEVGAGVFNGDIGYITKITTDSEVHIELYDGREIVYEHNMLDEIELCYACTVHRYQGSEVPIVVIPVIGQMDFLNRNNIYTAITRGRILVVCVGSKNSMRKMIDNVNTNKKNTGLTYRLEKLKEVLNDGNS
jgi:exodeoxyribonuclease V alpha subunit